jgi:hypothetical protein
MITDEEAAIIAKDLAQAEGWPWRIPVSIKKDKKIIVVRTNTKAIGCNIVVSIDATSGKILKKSFLPR